MTSLKTGLDLNDESCYSDNVLYDEIVGEETIFYGSSDHDFLPLQTVRDCGNTEQLQVTGKIIHHHLQHTKLPEV